jgi:hypothetical protein
LFEILRCKESTAIPKAKVFFEKNALNYGFPDWLPLFSLEQTVRQLFFPFWLIDLKISYSQKAAPEPFFPITDPFFKALLPYSTPC